MKALLYVIVASAFIGARLFSIDIRIMQLSLYRLSLYTMIFYLMVNNLFLYKKLDIKIKDRQSLIIRLYFFWFMYAVYSLAWVIDIRKGIRDVFFIGSGFLCIWLFSEIIKSERDFRGVFNITFLMIVFHNILGWFELETGKYYFADLNKIDRYSQFSYNKAARTPITLFSNINDYATLMLLGVFISFIILLNSKNLLAKILSSLTLLSSILLMLRTGSRGNIAGLVLGIIAVVTLILVKRINKYILIALISLSLIFVVVYPSVDQSLMTLIVNKVLSRFGTQSLSIRSDTTRLNLIKNGLVFLLNTGGFGTGAGNIEYWMETRQIFYVGQVFNIHNWWAEILVSYGVIIFTVYIFIYFLKIKTLLNAYLKSANKFVANTSLGFFGFMIAFIIGSVSSSSNINTEWLWMNWAIIIAFIGYIIRNMGKREILESS